MVIYTALLMPALAVLVWIATSDPKGFAYFSMSVAGLVALLLGYQVLAHYRDLRSPLVETEGLVTRVWSRADLVIAWHSYYVSIECNPVAGAAPVRKLLRLQPEEYVHLEDRFRSTSQLDPPGTMYVKVVHFPMTLSCRVDPRGATDATRLALSSVKRGASCLRRGCGTIAPKLPGGQWPPATAGDRCA